MRKLSFVFLQPSRQQFTMEFSNQYNEIIEIVDAEMEKERNEIIEISDDEDVEMERNGNGEQIFSEFFFLFLFFNF